MSIGFFWCFFLIYINVQYNKNRFDVELFAHFNERPLPPYISKYRNILTAREQQNKMRTQVFSIWLFQSYKFQFLHTIDLLID